MAAGASPGAISRCRSISNLRCPVGAKRFDEHDGAVSLADATCYGAAWSLPWPDFHRRVHHSFQDTPCGRLARAGLTPAGRLALTWARPNANQIEVGGPIIDLRARASERNSIVRRR
jgi:hypothetical protein